MKFKELMLKQKMPSLVSIIKFEILHELLLKAPVLGDFAEIGVYKGGTANFIANFKAQNRNLFLIDTFEGIPYSNKGVDLHKVGDFKDVDFVFLKKFFEEYRNTVIFKDKFINCMEFLKENVFSFVHIDVDVYESYVETLNFFYPRMVNGGILLFDDYNAKTCPGAKLAVDKFVEKNKLCLQTKGPNQAWIIKGNG